MSWKSFNAASMARLAALKIRLMLSKSESLLRDGVVLWSIWFGRNVLWNMYCHLNEFLRFGAVKFGCGGLLFFCLPFFLFCRSLIGLLCAIAVGAVLVVRLVVGRFDFAFDVKSPMCCLIMRFVVLSFCVVFHVGCRFICGRSCAVALFLHCLFVVWMGVVGFDAIVLMVVIILMVYLMIL